MLVYPSIYPCLHNLIVGGEKKKKKRYTFGNFNTYFQLIKVHKQIAELNLGR